MTTRASCQPAPRGLRLFFALGARLERGALSVTLPDGQVVRFEGKLPGPDAAIVVRRARVVRRLLLGGSVGFGESYMDGDWDTPDLAALLELACVNDAAVGGMHRGSWLTRQAQRLWHAVHANSRRGSRRNIAHHYDLGNAFYARWLDPTMTYSSAIFAKPGEDLSAAQTNKYRHIASKLELRPGHRVLEIGCGWGGFAAFAAREYGCRVTAITVSRAQLAFAQSRIQRDGLGERVDARFLDYRDVTERFDRIASIEMFEAVGERYWPAFFAKIRDSLEPGGRAALQVITIADSWFDSYRRGVDFIQRYIFPGGMLPSPTAFRQQLARANLVLERQEFFGAHYAQTLGAWRKRFVSAWPELAPMGFDTRFRRMWEFYLAYCEAGFRAGSIDVAQTALVRP